jgi:glycosyltransferase involved in cell wall biosynthesis
MPWLPTDLGGVNVSILGLARALAAARRFRPVIAVASWSPIEVPREVRSIPVIELRLHDAYHDGAWGAAKSALRLPVELPALAKALRIHDVEVVNVHFPSLGGAVFLLLRDLGLYRGKVALTFHGSDIRRADRSRLLQRLAWSRLISGADAVFVVSQSLAALARNICPEKQPRVIYNGADIELFSRVSKRPSAGTKRILHIGKFEDNKSQEVLLTALQLLLERGLDCRLTLIGASGSSLERVKQAAAAYGDRVRVLVDVQHEQIPEYMADSDLFVLPSRAEGFPIVLIEAGAAGLPVVATNISGITELITHGSTGLLVEPGDPRALANAMARVLASDELAHSLASALHARAVGYTWQRAADEFTAALS